MSGRVGELETQVGNIQQGQASVDVRDLKVDKVTVAGDLTVGGNILVQQGLTVEGDVEVKGNSIFHKVATFFGKVFFKGDVEIAGTATFNSDTAGFALVKTGQQTVHVSFEKPYATTPVVNISRGAGGFTEYAYSNLTPSGFDIVLKTPATTDQQFSWTAISVNGAKVSQNE